MRNSLVMAVCGALLACGGPSDSAGPAGNTAFAAETGGRPFYLTAMQVEGRTIYETVCWTCHGISGRGDGPAVEAGSIPAPPTFQADEYAESSGDALAERFDQIGRDPSHPHMQYVSSLLKPERFGAALSFIPALSYPPDIPGSAYAGEKLYSRRCVGCHGEDGRGNGPAAPSLILMSPADFTSDTLIASGNWEGVFQRIREGGRAVHGSSMPPWGIVLSEVETWDLVAFVATFQPDVLTPPAWTR
jgi:cytochrome c oxidase cbb3-type subunit 3